MSQMPRQSGAARRTAPASTTAVLGVRAADKRAAALEPAACAASSTMGGSSFNFADKRAVAPSASETSSTMGSSLIFSFSCMSGSRRRSWNSLESCLHCALCPR
eukprot:CAMPEP_0206830762 /NCGR_PEP_ID=MMETSP0975-20121206/17043_1 /ASSEMBLY_ACC=CAM_ASM_000399 /TAXON_ID=483370 /ORGANISM="non described non described, Strain CCMP2097" /LENGTH=103 /DNA_ID=CAMNT_0054373131 /DNA_START=296 /DNA_END=604 /DNA_ORIENTATION=-